MTRPDVLVVGGGVIGCAAARELASAGVRTLVLERDEPGAQASWAAAGMLAPLVEADEPGPFLSLLLASRARYPDFAAALAEETGIDVGYRTEGTLLAALTEADERELEQRFRWQSGAGLAVERLSAADALALEPALNPALRAALRFPEDHQVENRLLARALWFAAARAGATVRTGAEARRLLVEGERVTGVELTSGERVEADAVVLAGGAWAGRLEGLPTPLPVEPVHGQLLALEVQPGAVRHVLDTPRVYLVPRADGRLLVGATVERIGFRKAVTPAGLLRLLSAALEAIPSLLDAPVVEQWSGLRPGTPDGLPVLGPDPWLRNLVYATGHFRNGVLLTPVTAEIVRDLVLRGGASHDLAPFSVSRF